MDIKARIKEQGFTISQVASLMTSKDANGNIKNGISQSSLSQLITGNPTYERLKEIAGIIGLSVSELVADDSTFTAFVRNGEELKFFDSKESLLEYAESLCKEND